MLNNVPTSINKQVRNVVMNHPNRFLAVMVRKTVTRASDSELMGLPTIGGLGVLSSEDEESVAFESLGNAYALRADGMFAPAIMMERQDANNGSSDNFVFLIEPEDVNAFEIKKNDLLYLDLDGQRTVMVAFEIVVIETTTNIPPYTKRYICNRRDDLHIY